MRVQCSKVQYSAGWQDGTHNVIASICSAAPVVYMCVLSYCA